jgi:CRISPR system Cascade subunit CasB
MISSLLLFSPSQTMTPEDIFQNLAECAAADTATVAVLRRSLAYEPGLYPPAFPYVEPLTHGQGEWRRRATYLAAACWAKGQRAQQDEPMVSGIDLASALRKLLENTKQGQAVESLSKSLTKRFTALLDADPDELPWRLRQITSQLSAADIAIDWLKLLNDLWYWNRSDRSVQVNWARQFWSASQRAKKEEEEPTAPS